MPHPYLYPPGLDYLQLQSETLWLLARTADLSAVRRQRIKLHCNSRHADFLSLPHKAIHRHIRIIPAAE